MSGGSQTNIPLCCIAVRLQIGENSNGLVWRQTVTGGVSPLREASNLLSLVVACCIL